MFSTRFCTARDFQSNWFLQTPPLHDSACSLHRKSWEIAFVRATVDRPGGSLNCIGFGVGNEPLAKHFAACGHCVLATDLQADDWRHVHGDLTGMASAGLPTRQVDMNWIDQTVTERGYDACWSLCSMDHLGSVWLIKRFVLNSLNVLRPGGIAAHTAEYSLCPDMPRSGPTSYLNVDDIEDLQQLTTKLGHTMAPIDWHFGSHQADHVIDPIPYANPIHLKPGCEGNRWTTSVGIAAKRGPNEFWIDVDEATAREQIKCLS